MKDRNFLILLFGLTFLYFSIVSIIRHLSLSSAAYDLGNLDQAVWNAAHGNSLFSTIKYPPQGGNLMGDHFEPILFLIAPLYFLWSNVLVLLIVQSFLLASAIVPLYLIAREILKDRVVIFAFLVCYVLSKSVRGIAFFDFYPESFIIPALFWAYYFLIKRNDMLLWISVIVILCCKEDMVFLVLGLGLFTLTVQQRRGLGISFIILAIFLWWLETGIIIPYYSPMHNYEYMDKLPFGATYLDNFRFCIFHPILFIKFIFTKKKIDYVMRLFGPLGFLSLLAPPQLILIIVPLLKNLLGTEKSSIYYTINAHYVAGLIPLVFISAVYGAHVLLQKLKIKKANIIVVLSLIGFTLVFYGKSDGYRISEFLNNMRTGHTLEKIKLLDLIPPDASVMATSSLCPHLSHRKYIYLLDPTGGHAIPPKIPEYITIDKARLSSKEILFIDNYLNAAEDKGYKVIANVQNGVFLILTHP